MRWSVASIFGFLLLIGNSGCRSCHRVEAELRAREDDVRQLKDELGRCESYNHALQNELQCLKGGGPPLPGMPVVEKTIGVTPVRTLVIGRQTAGRSDGGCNGDDCLQVQVEPRDPEGQAVKVTGSLLIQVYEINPEGLKRPLSSWEITPEQLRKSWRNGLLSTGYQIVLPWKNWPTTEKVRVVAQFRALDGKLFEAERDVAIHLPPAHQRRMLSPEELAVGPEMPGAIVIPPPAPAPKPLTPGPVVPIPTEEVLPAPRPLPEPPPGSALPAPGKPIANGSVSSITVWRPVMPPVPAQILRPTPQLR